MDKNFSKFKRRVRLQAIAASALLGAGLSALAVAVILLINKLSSRTTAPLTYLIAVAAAIAVSLLIYFLLMPSDKRLARRLDSLYSLDERISTMVEFRNDNGVFAVLQREDADMRLGEKPVKALKSRQLVAGLLVFFISLGCIFGAMLVPAKADGGEAPIDEFDKQWIITAIEELLHTVESAYINESLRSVAKAELNELLDFVKSSDYLSEMKSFAIGTVIAINDALYKSNSAEALSVAFAQSTNGGLKDLAKQMGELAGSGSKAALEALGEAVDAMSNDDAEFIADELNSYLASSGVKIDDTLYLLFKELIFVIRGGADIADSFADAAKTLSAEVIVQNVNRTTVRIVISKLCNLFGITEDDITSVDPEADVDIRDPSTDPPIQDDPNVDDPDNPMDSGGLGTGEVIYGSNDLVFDPDTNTYRPYGELLSEYFAKASELMADGKTSEEIEAMAKEYFEALFGGVPKND